jgi:uncharacterized repeat protein (TIGR01451 family)
VNQSNRIRPALLVAAWLMAGASAAQAQQVASELAVMRVVKVIEANGRPGAEQLASAEGVRPGDLLQYTTTFRNTGTLPARRLAATLPIPAGTEFVTAPDTAAGELQASLNGTDFAAVPLMRQVKKPDGQTVAVPVPLTEYRALRWPARDLAAGTSYTTQARVRVAALPAGATLAAATPAATAAAR